MILIDQTYFKGELSLPILSVSNPCDEELDGVALALQTVGENNLDGFVDKYVTDYLVRLMGLELTQTFLAEIETDSPAQIWTNLQKQLLIQFGTYKTSPLANYVYYWLMRDARTKTTTAGEADAEFDNAKNVNNQYKLVKAWNDMANTTLRIQRWLCQNKAIYAEYAADCTDRNICSLTMYINTFGL